MLKKLREYVEYMRTQSIKQILEGEGIQVLLKSSSGIGQEYFGSGVMYDIYVSEEEYEIANSIVEKFEKGGIILDELKKTPLYEKHKELGAKMGEFAGWELPLWYTSIIDEHKAVRENVGIFDVSHMGELFVEGREAESCLNYLITNNVSKLEVGDILYSPMCNEQGGIIDDLLVYRISTDSFMLVVNASNTDKDFNWVVNNSKTFDVEVSNKSHEYSLISFQGPKVQEQLQKYLKEIDLEKFNYFTFKEIELEGENVLISRTGYTGEDGFEIYLSPKIVVKVWDNLINLTREVDGKPCGLGSRDTLRFEAKLLLYGNDIDETTTPLEANIKWTIDFSKDFIGKGALLSQMEEGIKRKLVGIEIFDKMPVRHGNEIYNNNDENIGYVTSGLKSPTLNKNLALGYVSIPYSSIGSKLTIINRNKRLSAQVVKTPFYRGSVKSNK